ncbi:uncharacterized protein LOC129922046 [Biomphalaria glabrata]|uniref:Uncharacterized protein LOC129922046 n=1 Tax=Biomphalaria glabrata TaxID=6526 RepID=A0A9W2YHB2_BIOGL|nr:uncharacterized protein LOC129922046 [Biomphalaria glabrata]
MSSLNFYKNCQSEEFLWLKKESMANADQGCKKNRHEKFYSVEASSKNLPKKYSTDEDLISQIREMAKLTVRLQTNIDPQSIRFGTGLIQRVRKERGKHGKSCPDKTCTKGEGHVYYVITVTTVYHVVSSQNEAEKTEVLPFFDQEGLKDDSKAFSVYKLLETDKETDNFDWCAIECVTHSEELVKDFSDAIENLERLQKATYSKYNCDTEKFVVMIGHPHGGPKKVSFGTWSRKQTLKEIRSTQDWCQYRHDTPSCPGSSGSPVLILGQPLCGYGYWFGHPHNHSAWDKEEHETVTSIGANSMAPST